MSVEVRVVSIDRNSMKVTVEAYNGLHRVFKGDMPYKIESRAHIESVLTKELKVFNRPSWGGMSIAFLCRIGGYS